jgi:hypothetical protein
MASCFLWQLDQKLKFIGGEESIQDRWRCDELAIQKGH